jgi:S-adenosylmethionine decarboxylase
MKTLGRHLLVELYECNRGRLDDVEFIRAHLIQSALIADSTVINSAFHHFSPVGVSGVVIIAESNITIHTWPEHGYAAIDVFTCGDDIDPWRAFAYLRDALESKSHDVKEVQRGVLPATAPESLERPFIKSDAERERQQSAAH